VYLAGLPPANAGGQGGGASPLPAGPSADEVAWSFVKDTKDRELLRRFIAQFPASPRRPEAAERLKALDQTNIAMTLPVRPTEAARPAGGPCGGAATVSLASRSAAPLSAAEECGLQPKASFKECAQCPEMVVVSSGSFMMGSPEGEVLRDSD